MAKDEPIVTYRTYYDPMLAHIERTKLEDAGIQCFIADENMATINMLYNNAIGGIKLKVFECDIEKCDAILNDTTTETTDEFEETPAVTPELFTQTNCPYCGSTNVRYGSATEKKHTFLGGIVWTFFSILFSVLPLASRKAWHCFNCGKDFE